MIMASASRPYLVEVSGVAGAGKSTLVRRICEADGNWRRAAFINARTPRHLVYIARTLPRVFPILIRNLGPRPRLSWADFKLLVYVSGWDRFFDRTPEYRGGITALDQGPVYALVRLKAQGKRVTSSAVFERWWNDMIELWADELAAVIYLDASDQVLWDRINGRAQAHTMKGEPAGVGQAFIARYRQLFEEILDRLDRPGGPSILRLDTSATSAQQLATDIQQNLADLADRHVLGGEGHR